MATLATKVCVQLLGSSLARLPATPQVASPRSLPGAFFGDAAALQQGSLRPAASPQQRDGPRVGEVLATTAAPRVRNVTSSSVVTEEKAPLTQLYKDYAVGYKSLTSDCETEGWMEVIEGEVPKELTGTLLRNGPAMFKRGDFEKVFLDGDGMVHSYCFKDGKAYFRNKFVRTESFKREEAAGAYLDPSIFTAPDPRPAHSGMPAWHHRLVDDIFHGPPSPKHNGAYNAWYWAGSLVAVDFGKPHGLNPENLDTVGAVDAFSKEKFTAHSRQVVEADGSQRLITFSPAVDWAKAKTTVTFAEWDESGAKVAESVHEFGVSYFHDLIVTDNYYILFDCPIKMDYKKTFIGYPLSQNSLGDTVSEDRDKPPLFRLFPRRPGLKTMEIPCTNYHCYAYHHINGFESAGGKKIVFDTCTWSKFSLYFMDIVVPDGTNFFPRTEMSRFVIDLETGEATRHRLNQRPCEYPIVPVAVQGKPYRHSYMSTSAVEEKGVWGPMQSLTKVSIASASADCLDAVEEMWHPGQRKFVGEPLFVEKPGSDGSVEDEGWVVVLVHNSADASTELAILDSEKIKEGPIALLKLPQYVPMGVHGSWTPSYILGPDEKTPTKASSAKAAAP